MTGVKLVAKDANENSVPSFNGASLSVLPIGIVAISNIQPAGDSPTGSAYTFDIAALGPLGQATITADGQQGNFQPHFDTDFTIEVIADPSTPGPPTHWLVTPGTVSAQ